MNVACVEMLCVYTYTCSHKKIYRYTYENENEILIELKRKTTYISSLYLSKKMFLGKVKKNLIDSHMSQKN